MDKSISNWKAMCMCVVAFLLGWLVTGLLSLQPKKAEKEEKHMHQWSSYSVPSHYSSAMPFSGDYIQVRTCTNCGISEKRTF